jgi:hypothetical protein
MRILYGVVGEGMGHAIRFFPAPVRKARTTLVPPILRPEILNSAARRGDHWLIYQTAEGYDALLAFRAFDAGGGGYCTFRAAANLTQQRILGCVREPNPQLTGDAEGGKSRGDTAGDTHFASPATECASRRSTAPMMALRTRPISALMTSFWRAAFET